MSALRRSETACERWQEAAARRGATPEGEALAENAHGSAPRRGGSWYLKGDPPALRSRRDTRRSGRRPRHAATPARAAAATPVLRVARRASWRVATSRAAKHAPHRHRCLLPQTTPDPARANAGQVGTAGAAKDARTGPPSWRARGVPADLGGQAGGCASVPSQQDAPCARRLSVGARRVGGGHRLAVVEQARERRDGLDAVARRRQLDGVEAVRGRRAIGAAVGRRGWQPRTGLRATGKEEARDGKRGARGRARPRAAAVTRPATSREVPGV